MRERSLPGESWWSLSHVIKYPDCYKALSLLAPFAVDAPVAAPLPEWGKAVTEWMRSKGYTGPDLETA